ncbi:hypothetical protein DL770_010075 [Monosporascus sp. CRB-9-2]|nr:hypothetical protein DL770_010075 [Monosporascus sp. CRB-9-2]
MSQTSWQEPACVFQPSSAAQLEEAILFIVARNDSLAVRSGGHRPAPVAANIDNGVEYDAESNVVVIGAGLEWGVVYSQLEQVERHCVFILNSGKLDHALVDSQVVPADGSVVNANAESHPDLFLALKGGVMTLGFVLNMVYLEPEEPPSAFGPFYSINTAMDLAMTSAYCEFLASPRLCGLASSVRAAAEEMIGEVDKASEAEANYVLRDMRAKYDPDCMSQRLVRGG